MKTTKILALLFAFLAVIGCKDAGPAPGEGSPATTTSAAASTSAMAVTPTAHVGSLHRRPSPRKPFVSPTTDVHAPEASDPSKHLKYTPVQSITTFVYQQGGTPNAATSTYATWASLYAAAITIGVQCPIVIVDGSMGQPLITAGSYAMGCWSLVGNAAFPVLNIANGANITSEEFIISNLNLNSLAMGAPSITLTGSFPILYLLNSPSLSTDATATQALFQINAGSTVSLVTGVASFISPAAAQPVFSVASGGTLNVFGGQGSFMASGSIAGAGVVTVEALDPSFEYKAQAGVTGTFSYKPALSTYFNGSYLFQLPVTLMSGTRTVASGKDLTFAYLLGCQLTTPNTAVGSPVATFVAGPNGNVTVTSKTAAATTAMTDASTYTCTFTGAF